MSMSGDHPIPTLPVMKVDAVPDWPSSLIARRGWCGVLLRGNLGFWENARIGEGRSRLEHRAGPKLVQLAEA